MEQCALGQEYEEPHKDFDGVVGLVGSVDGEQGGTHALEKGKHFAVEGDASC